MWLHLDCDKDKLPQLVLECSFQDALGPTLDSPQYSAVPLRNHTKSRLSTWPGPVDFLANRTVPLCPLRTTHYWCASLDSDQIVGFLFWPISFEELRELPLQRLIPRKSLKKTYKKLLVKNPADIEKSLKKYTDLFEGESLQDFEKLLIQKYLTREVQDLGFELKSGFNTCSICLSNLLHDDLAISFPMCTQPHVFHEGCLLPWLERNHSCPLCKNSLRQNLIRHLSRIDKPSDVLNLLEDQEP